MDTPVSPRRICFLCHNVRSLWNVGSFFRTCDAFAVEKLYLTGYTGCPPRKEITKTALGAEDTVPWEHFTDPVPIVKKLKEDGWQIVALELHPDAIPLQGFKPSSKTCILVGHELSGVPEELMDLANQIVSIPMLGQKESLNVAVAAGIALHFARLAD